MNSKNVLNNNFDVYFQKKIRIDFANSDQNFISKNLILSQTTFQDAKDVSNFFDSKQEFGSQIFQISLQIHKKMLYFIN